MNKSINSDTGISYQASCSKHAQCWTGKRYSTYEEARNEANLHNKNSHSCEECAGVITHP